MTTKTALLIKAVSSSLALERNLLSGSDSFLELGGDSLAALYVCEDLNTNGYKLDPADLFSDDPLEKVAIGMKSISNQPRIGDEITNWDNY